MERERGVLAPARCQPAPAGTPGEPRSATESVVAGAAASQKTLLTGKPARCGRAGSTQASLRVELRDGLLPNATAAVIQLGIAGLTAIQFGNVAKEFAFDLSARFTMWWGRPFVRNGLTRRLRRSRIARRSPSPDVAIPGGRSSVRSSAARKPSRGRPGPITPHFCSRCFHASFANLRT
jgi:hypothetical protein